MPEIHQELASVKHLEQLTVPITVAIVNEQQDDVPTNNKENDNDVQLVGATSTTVRLEPEPCSTSFVVQEKIVKEKKTSPKRAAPSDEEASKSVSKKAKLCF